MIGKNIFPVLIGIIVNIEIIHCAVTCTFRMTPIGYECLLLNQNIRSDDDMMVIDGSHESEFTHANVTRLRARDSTIRVFPSLIVDQFENLVSVDLSGVEMRFFTLSITKCSSLESVYLSENRIFTFSGGIFSNCSNLRMFYMQRSGVRFLDSHAFAGTNITELYLHNNNIEFLQPGFFANLPHLDKLSLANNAIEEILPGTFESSPKLSSITLSGNKLKSWGRHNLPELSVLIIDANQITSVTSDSFAGMPNLSWLDLKYNFLAEMPTLQGLDQLTFLCLINNTVTHIHAESFMGLKSLQSLEITLNQIESINFTITDETFLPIVKRMSFQGNQLTSIDDLILPVNVTNIDFSGNKLTHLKVNSIQPISQLRYLYLEDNEIRRIDREFFNDAVNLTVFLKNNRCFSDTIRIRDIGDLEQDGSLLERCFSHATTTLSSIALLVVSLCFCIFSIVKINV